MRQARPCKLSFRESIKALEADMLHANSLAAALPSDRHGYRVHMRLSYSPIAPVLNFFLEWMDYSCTDAILSHYGLLHILINQVNVDGVPQLSSRERKATLREFYAVMYPWLKQLEGEFAEVRGFNRGKPETAEDRRKLSDGEEDRDDECGICMESPADTVLPSCGHSMCISCFSDWNLRSDYCPFCRGSVQGISSTDLWFLMGENDVIDVVSLAMENLRNFYLYIESLCMVLPAPFVPPFFIT